MMEQIFYIYFNNFNVFKEVSWIEMEGELEEFIAYLEYTWIGRKKVTRDGQRGRALNRYGLWSQFEAIQKDKLVSTNNNLESWNRTWNQLMGMKPNVWKVVEGFKDQEAESRRILLSNAIGRDMTTNTGRLSLSRCHNERIRNLVMQYNTMPSKEYMQLVAHELSLH